MSETQKLHHKAGEHLNKLEIMLDLYLVKKAPALPKGAKDFIVKFSPWIIIVLAIFAVPAVFTLFGLTTMMSANPYGAAFAASLGPTYYLRIILLVVVIALELIALPGLFAIKKSGWNLVFYASLVSALSSLIDMNLGSFIIGTLISLYLLFQVRSYYK